MTRSLLISMTVVLAACDSNPRPAPIGLRVAAARALTERCARSRLAAWELRASAAGRDCDVLLVDSPLVLDDSMIEALHYGGGIYSVVDGGVQAFSRQRAFRGVAYRDATARVWRYGDVTASETPTLKRCD